MTIKESVKADCKPKSHGHIFYTRFLIVAYDCAVYIKIQTVHEANLSISKCSSGDDPKVLFSLSKGCEYGDHSAYCSYSSDSTNCYQSSHRDKCCKTCEDRRTSLVGE